MDDLPDDLPSVGRHRGNDPPTETGKEVRSPEGPAPDSSPASPAPALFQLIHAPDRDRLQIRVHSARTEEPPMPDADDVTEIGQYRSVDDLRTALREKSIEGRVAVFEDAESETVLTDEDVTPSHAWIGQPRYERITFVADAGDVSDYVSGLEYPLA
ncbi:MAG: hypothetical protein BRD55_11860 [Bacteroidetes bacterium SW_9_63_38]|nr:MAG: hypothetical protein BRD55_11860 [Bacteroidetes bacterium SW_9_63_38]